jgi:drug/metabolite transporter (DMT)-like permease
MYFEKRWFQYSVLLFLALIWGSSFILMKIGLNAFTSEQVAALRIVLASLALLPFAVKSLKSFRKQDLKSLLIISIIGSLIPAFFFTKAETRIDSALAGMLNSLTPVFTLIIGILFYEIHFNKRQIFGLLIGLAGAYILLNDGKSISLTNINSYALFVVAATICYSISVNEVKAHLTHLNGIQLTSLSFLIAGPVAFVYLLTTDFTPALASQDFLVSFGAIAALGIIGTALAMLFMNHLIGYVSAVFASTVTYIIPIFAIFWGILAGETITAFHFTGMAVILIGIALVNSKSKN